MSIWIIGGIAYLAVLLFALALARVASAPDEDDRIREVAVEQHPDYESSPSARVAGDGRS